MSISGVVESAGAAGALASTVQPVAIVVLVLVLGAAAYLWHLRYLRSRAAMITLAAIVLVLAYLGFFAG